MTTRPRHLGQHEDFKKGAELDANPPQVRVESIFLAVFHLIDACAATHNVHINKHQRVRYELERNPAVFGKRTEEIWLNFQDIEARLRPDRKSTRLNSSHVAISYAVFCLKKK